MTGNDFILAFRIAHPESGLPDDEIPSNWEDIERIQNKEPDTITATFRTSVSNTKIAQLSRKKKVDRDEVGLAYKRYAERHGKTRGAITALALQFDCSKTTVSKILRELNIQLTG